MPRLMLVDDEVNILSSLRRALIAMPEGTFPSPLSIETFASPVQALARAHEMAFDLVISDYRMPEMDGVAFLEKLREIQPDYVAMYLMCGQMLEGRARKAEARAWYVDGVNRAKQKGDAHALSELEGALNTLED